MMVSLVEFATGHVKYFVKGASLADWIDEQIREKDEVVRGGGCVEADEAAYTCFTASFAFDCWTHFRGF